MTNNSASPNGNNRPEQQTGSGLVSGDRSRPSTGFVSGYGIDDAVDRYLRRSESIATLLTRQLEAAASFHDLSKQQLRSSHRSVLALTRGGSVPTPLEFWEQTAQPQARNLFDAARGAVDRETAELTKALQQYATAIRLDIRANGGKFDTRWTADQLQQVAEDGIRTVAVTVKIVDDIDELGRWWQARLRRKAVIRSAAKVLTAPLVQFELIVSATEMTLLEQPPWSHDDRLLSAFELAHSDIREYALDLERRLKHRAHSMLESVAREDLIDGRSPQPSVVDSDDPVALNPLAPDDSAARELWEPQTTIELG